jgi:hypothetical protein
MWCCWIGDDAVPGGRDRFGAKGKVLTKLAWVVYWASGGMVSRVPLK